MKENNELLSVNKPLDEKNKPENNLKESLNKINDENQEKLNDVYNKIDSQTIVNNNNKNDNKNNIDNEKKEDNDKKNDDNNKIDNKSKINNNNNIDNKKDSNNINNKNTSIINNNPDNKNSIKNDNNIDPNKNDINSKVTQDANNNNNVNADIKTHEINTNEKLNNNNNENDKKPLEKQESIHLLEAQIREQEKIYEIDPEFKTRLLEALSKKGKIRPKTIFNLETIDRTKTTAEIENLLQKTEEQNKIHESEPNTNTNIINNNPTEKKLNSLSDSIALFGPVKKIYMDQYYKISDLFVCCPLYFNYRLSFDFGTGVQFHLFDSKEYSPACSHNCCPNQAREIDIDLIKYDILTGRKYKFLTMKKDFRCACFCCCACCSRPTMNVTIDNKLIGKIIEVRTACDPTIYVFNYLEDLKFKIKGSCCQCGYCFKDLCSECCKKCEFDIFTSRDLENTKSLGKIKKFKVSGEKVRPDYDQLEIDFPEDANPNDKILILCATFLLETLYFQNHSNSKRCHGDPLY